MNYLRGSDFGSCSISIFDLVGISVLFFIYVVALLYLARTKGCLIKNKSF
jgi:hypothetical protein